MLAFLQHNVAHLGIVTESVCQKMRPNTLDPGSVEQFWEREF